MGSRCLITHDVLINGGKLVLPDFSAVEKSVDKDAKLLIIKKKSFPRCAQDVDKYVENYSCTGDLLISF